MSSKKPTRTRDQYKAHLQRRKAEKLVEAVQRVAETYDVRPLRTLCSRMKSQENTRIKRAKLGKKADVASMMWRNPLDLSAGYGITALHVAYSGPVEHRIRLTLTTAGSVAGADRCQVLVAGHFRFRTIADIGTARRDAHVRRPWPLSQAIRLVVLSRLVPTVAGREFLVTGRAHT